VDILKVSVCKNCSQLYVFLLFSYAILSFHGERNSYGIELKSKFNRRQSCLVSRPCCAPVLWTDKWLDYSDKYGFGYQLSDDSIGVSFNEKTRMALLPDGVVGTLKEKYPVEL